MRNRVNCFTFSIRIQLFFILCWANGNCSCSCRWFFLNVQFKKAEIRFDARWIVFFYASYRCLLQWIEIFFLKLYIFLFSLCLICEKKVQTKMSYFYTVLWMPKNYLWTASRWNFVRICFGTFSMCFKCTGLFFKWRRHIFFAKW